jgi:phage tail sheath protein FI
MPSTLTFPGVYIEEIPSGVRTITGVATSITAFVGRALRGPINEPVVINSYGDFERIFGGLWVPSTMSYAVRDFYLNGGSQAIIVRLFTPTFATETDRQTALTAATGQAQTAADAVKTAVDTAAAAGGATAASVAQAATDAVAAAGAAGAAALEAATAVAKAANDAAAVTTPAATPASVKTAAAGAVAGAVTAATNNAAPITRASLTVNGLKLEAASEGTWGNNLRVRIDDDVMDNATIAQVIGPTFTKADVFNLTVRDMKTGATEQFRNLTAKNSARVVDKVLTNESLLLKVSGTAPFPRPTAHATPDPGKDGFEDDAHSTGVTAPASNGQTLDRAAFSGSGLAGAKKGLFSLENADLFNLLCIPPHAPEGSIEKELIDDAIDYCEQRRAMMLVDSPDTWKSKATAKSGIATGAGKASKNAALYFPRVKLANPLHGNQIEEFVPCGMVAGMFSRTDATRGVWKAPAGLDTTLAGVAGLVVPLTNAENGELNPLGINCLRIMPAVGPVLWGARTRVGDDRLASEWKYVPVRRTALFLEESLYRALQWVVFEPNDEPLWAQIRLNVGAFMNSLFRQGAFQGQSPREAYFVKCDKETTTQNDIDRGIVNILVGFAPLKPAEFVVIKLQQIAGQIQT